VHETFPDGESMESFIMLESGQRVTVRVSSESGLVNLYIRTEIPEDLTKAEALVRALINTGQEFGASRPEVSHYRTKSEASIQMLWRT